MRIYFITTLFALLSLPPLSAADDYYDVEQVVHQLTTLKQALAPSDRENTCSTLDDYDFRKDQYSKNETKKLPWCDKNILCKPFDESKSFLPFYSSDDGILYDGAGYIAQAHLLKCQMDKIKTPKRMDFPEFTRQQMGAILAIKVGLENEVRDSVKEGRPLNRELVQSFIDKADRNKVLSPEKREEFIKYIVTRRQIEHNTRAAIEKNLPQLGTLTGLTLLDTPGFFDGLTLSEKHFSLYHDEYQKRMDKGASLLEELKQDYKSYFNERVGRGEMSEKDAQVLVKRIETLELTPPQYPGAECFFPNAYYNPLRHQISVCPQMLNYPKETLAMVLSHEMGHSIDPCMSSKKLVAFKKEASFKSSLDKESMQKLLENGKIDKRLFSYRTKETDKQNDYIVDYVQEVEHGFTTMKPSDYQIVDQGYSSKTHPMAKEIACLTTFRSINARDNDSDEVAPMLKAQYEAIKNNPKSAIAVAHYKAQSENPERADYWKYCTLDQNSPVQTGEAYADFMAGEIAKERIQNYPKELRKAKSYEATAFILSDYCENRDRQRSLKMINKELKKNGCAEMALSSKSFKQKITALFEPEGAHPPSGERMDDIFLANPELTKNLGCKQSGRYCGE